MKLLAWLVMIGGFAGFGVCADKPLTWPQFRGPNGSGIAHEQNPPIAFGPEKNVQWKVPAPSGLSSPIVAGENLVITAFEGEKLFTIAYNRANGKEAWRAQAPAKQIEGFHKTEGSPAASTPATDGARIVSYFGSCGLLCYDLSGKELWRFEMPPASTAGQFGSGVSPIIVDGTVVLVRDETKEPKIVAFDLKNGSVKWERRRLSLTSYCTPVAWDTPAGKQIVAAGHARMIGYDLVSGAEKWSVTGVPSACCASPVVADGLVFFAGGTTGPEDKEMEIPSFDSMLEKLDTNKDGALDRAEAEKAFEGFFDNQDANKDGKVSRDEWDAIIKFMSEGKNSAFALKAGGNGDVTESHVLWKKTKGLPYVSSAIVYGGQCVMVKDGGIVTAYDAKTGAEVYQERIADGGTYYASPIGANGRIYFTSRDGGAVTVIKAGSPKPEVLAKNPKLGERTAATPALANNVLFIRTDKHLYAFAEAK